MWIVALLAEGVDRNSTVVRAAVSAVEVALLAEGVDRNVISCIALDAFAMSPSSRRAWIEIS